jgi:hypothetical protein
MAQRGRPFQAGNKFGHGRPRGSRNKATKLAQEILFSRAEAIAAKVTSMALQGDGTAMKIVMDRICPVRRETAFKLGAMPTKTAADVSTASEKILAQVAGGKLTIPDAQGLSELLDKRRRAIETEELEQRLRALESKHEKS